MDGKIPPPSKDTPFEQLSQDETEAEAQHAAYTSIRDMVYEFDQAWEAARTVEDYPFFMHAVLIGELDRRLRDDADNEQRVADIERQRRMINDGDYQLPGDSDNFGQMAQRDPSLAIPVMGSLEVGTDGRTVTDFERSDPGPQADTATSNQDIAAWVTGPAGPIQDTPDAPPSSDPEGRPQDIAASLPIPTDPYFQAVMDGAGSDHEAALSHAQDEEESQRMVESALAFLEERAAVVRARKALLSTATPDKGESGRKRSRPATSTSPKQAPKKRKSTTKKIGDAADDSAEDSAEEQDEGNAKKPNKFLPERLGTLGYDPIGEVQDNTLDYNCPIKGCNTTIAPKRDFHRHMRYGPDDESAKDTKGHGVASVGFRDKKGHARKRGFLVVVYNETKRLWIGKDHLHGNRWYLGGFRDREPYERGVRDGRRESERNNSHVTLDVAADSKYSGLRAAPNETLKAVRSYRGLQGGDEQPAETNRMAQNDDGVDDADQTLSTLDVASGDDGSRRRPQARKASRQTSLRVDRGGHVGIVSRTPPAGNAIGPGPPQGQELHRLVVSAQEILREFGYAAHYPRVASALSLNKWNADAAAAAYIAWAQMRLANPPPPAAQSHEDGSEDVQDQAASNNVGEGQWEDINESRDGVEEDAEQEEGEGGHPGSGGNGDDQGGEDDGNGDDAGEGADHQGESGDMYN